MSVLDDVVLFACGGGANRIVADSRISDHIRIIPINPREAAISGEPDLAPPIASGNPDAIRSSLDGIRVAFMLAMLGGASGTGMLLETARVAKECGCRVVSIVGIPMQFEHERRERAMDAIREAVVVSDRMLLMDMGTVVELNVEANDPKFDAFFRISAHSLGFAVANLAEIVEGPFFSTFTERVYTFAYVTDIDPANAVRRALNATAFPTDPAYGKAVVTVSSGFGKAQTEQIFHTVVSNTGIIPDIVKREDREDTKVVVFLPARITPSSPRVSRS